MMFKFFGLSYKDFFTIMLGTALFSFGIENFANPIGLVTGGVAGLSIIISRIFSMAFGLNVSLSLLNILINIPIFIFSWLVNGAKFVKKSLIGILLVSFWLFVFQKFAIKMDVGNDIFAAAILTGVFDGVGLGLVLKTGASSGGTDMLANLVYKIFPKFSISITLFIIDALIILSGFFVFGLINTVYAIIIIFISSKLINSILGGLRFAKAVFILSQHSNEISEKIFEKLDRGNTEITCRGMYTKKEGRMLFVVVWPKELVKLKRIIGQIDPNAFITICSAQEVLGKGFLTDEL